MGRNGDGVPRDGVEEPHPAGQGARLSDGLEDREQDQHYLLG